VTQDERAPSFLRDGPIGELADCVAAEGKCPVESAFVLGDARGWRAAAPGSQTIRLVFDQPQRLKCISLVFEENETARTQEFVLRWSPDGRSSVKEIVRQQWNFSPPDSIREVEEYQVELSSVTVLELVINPFRRRILCPDFQVVAKISQSVANCGHGSEENQFRTNHNRTRQSRC
jgi:hypothetical protein